MKQGAGKNLPVFFKPLLWSYDFARINPNNNQKLIITQAINYGDLKHWRWISRYYGGGKVIKILKTIPAAAIRPQALRLASTLFH